MEHVHSVLPRSVRALSVAATACVLLAACGGAGNGGGGTGGATSGGGKGGGSAPSNSVAGGALAIPAGSSAAAQLKALKGCTPTPAPSGQEYWLVSDGSPNPTYTVPKATPTVGKSLATWPSQPMVVLGDCTDTESWTFVAGDAKNFYIAAQVDSTNPVVAGTAAAPWSGDVVQFAFDPADDKNAGSYDTTDDDEMGMIMLDQPFLFDNDSGGQEVTPAAITGGKVAITRNNGITLYEASIPWSSIGSPVSTTFGFNVAIAAGGPPYQGPNWGYEWTQGIIEGKNPADFAQLTFKK